MNGMDVKYEDIENGELTLPCAKKFVFRPIIKRHKRYRSYKKTTNIEI